MGICGKGHMSQSKRRLLGVSLSKFPEWMGCHTPLESSSKWCSNINLGVNHFLTPIPILARRWSKKGPICFHTKGGICFFRQIVAFSFRFSHLTNFLAWNNFCQNGASILGSIISWHLFLSWLRSVEWRWSKKRADLFSHQYWFFFRQIVAFSFEFCHLTNFLAWNNSYPGGKC